jgi:hypothetical protein
VLPARRHLIAIAVILVAGWGAAAAIYVNAAADSALPMELTDDAKLNIGRLERLSGKSAVIYEQLGSALGSLWHGANLGITIFVLTSLVALLYFYRASPGPNQRQ